MSSLRLLPPLALAALAAIVLAGCGGAEEESFDAAQYDGTYVGTWANEATGAEGAASIAIAIDEEAGTADLTIDFDGDYLGLGDPPAVTLEGTFDEDGAVARGTSELFGTYDVTIAPDGAITGLMEDVGGGAVPKLEYTGTLTDERLDADYDVTFADGKTASSILRLEKRAG